MNTQTIKSPDRLWPVEIEILGELAVFRLQIAAKREGVPSPVSFSEARTVISRSFNTARSGKDSK